MAKPPVRSVCEQMTASRRWFPSDHPADDVCASYTAKGHGFGLVSSRKMGFAAESRGLHGVTADKEWLRNWHQCDPH